MKFTKLKLVEDQLPRRTFDPELNAVTSTDAEIQKMLKREDIDDDTKVKLIGQKQRYKAVHMKPKQVVPEPMQVDSELIALETLPVSYREKGKQLLQRLKMSGKVNPKGQLIVNGQPMEGTNITDLLDDVLRHRKNNAPHGWDSFSQTLQELNIPKVWIGNPRYRQKVKPGQKRQRTEILRKKIANADSDGDDSDSDGTLTASSDDDDDDDDIVIVIKNIKRNLNGVKQIVGENIAFTRSSTLHVGFFGVFLADPETYYPKKCFL